MRPLGALGQRRANAFGTGADPKRPGADPVADDAATLALDLLLLEAGFARGGANLLAPAAG